MKKLRQANKPKPAELTLTGDELDAVRGGSDAIGTRDYAIDEITGASSIRGRKKRHV